MNINSESNLFSKKSIEHIESSYNAKYVYETELVSRGPVAAVFWQEEPKEGHSNWFGIYFDYRGNVMITNAAKTVELPIEAVHVGDDEWVYSHHVHDFRTVNGISIDGGRGYTRILASDLQGVRTAPFRPTKDGLVKLEIVGR